MNTAQKPLAAAVPPPCSGEHPADPNRTDLPTNKANNNVKVSFAEPDASRCQFTFSDGRQCRMQRSQLCAHHASKASIRSGSTSRPPAKVYPQDELSPVNKVSVNEGTLSDATDSPGCDSLQALCGDLTTATNINRALAQVFLLLAQGRIAQKQAVAFGYLSQLLLQTVPGIRSEFVSAFGWHSRLRH
jgi:hypothetical protein